MNIFVLDTDPVICAKYHVDKHCIKMILETAQLLCSAHWVLGNEAPYKLTHQNHPCAIWTRECIENYLWLCELGKALAAEYTFRYGKVHKTQEVIEWCASNLPKLPTNGSLTEFAKAMPEHCKVDDVVESYRRYYMMEKSEMANWKNREVPYWFVISQQSF